MPKMNFLPYVEQKPDLFQRTSSKLELRRDHVAFFEKAEESGKRSRFAINVNGRRFATIAEAAEYFGVNAKTASRKLRNIDRADQAAVDACFEPTGTHTRNPIPIKVRGKTFRSISAAAMYFGMAQSTVDSRLKKIEQVSEEEIDQCFIKPAEDA